MGLSPMMGALADTYESSEAVFYTTGAFGAFASLSAVVLMILKKREKKKMTADDDDASPKL